MPLIKFASSNLVSYVDSEGAITVNNLLLQVVMNFKSVYEVQNTEFCTESVADKYTQLNSHAETSLRSSHPEIITIDDRRHRHASTTECSHPLTSVPFTLTVSFTGKGDMPWAFEMSGTAVRPLSDDVCVNIL